MPLGIDFVQILLHVFNVVILFGGLYFLLYSPVRKFMEKREEHYRQMDEEKNTALLEADKLKKEHETALLGLSEEIAQKKRDAAKEIEDLRSKKVKEAQEEAGRIISKAEAEANRRRKEIVDGAKDDITGLIAEAADKIMISGDTESCYDAFLDDAEKSIADDSPDDAAAADAADSERGAEHV